MRQAGERRGSREVVPPRARDGSENPDAASGLGLLLANAGRTGEARRLFEQAIALQRDDAFAINNLGVLYINMGLVNDPIAAFQYGIRLAPDDDTLYLNLARVRFRMADMDKARDTMRALLARKPDDSVATKTLQQLGGTMIPLLWFFLPPIIMPRRSRGRSPNPAACWRSV